MRDIEGLLADTGTANTYLAYACTTPNAGNLPHLAGLRKPRCSGFQLDIVHSTAPSFLVGWSGQIDYGGVPL